MRRVGWGSRCVGRSVWQDAGEACIGGIRFSSGIGWGGVFELLQPVMRGDAESGQGS